MSMVAKKLTDSLFFILNKIMRSHHRQFVIGSEPFYADNTWCCHQLSSSLWVSHCPDLRVGWTQDLEGVKWGVLGLAIESIQEKLDPLKEIAKTNTTKVTNIYSSWSGRWVLFGNNQIHPDASSLLGCFYGIRDGKIWVSSSPVLLAKILFPARKPLVDSRVLTYEVGISWFTPPHSRFSGIQRLLPSQIIDFKEQKIKPRSLMPPIDTSRNHTEILDLVKSALITIIKKLQEVSQEIWLGLTAGYDSRLMLVLSRAAEVEIKPFTRIATRTSIADLVLPPELARKCGYDHVFMQVGKRDTQRQRLVVEHSGGHISEGDAEPFIKGVRQGMTGISFGGHGFAIASGFAKLPTLPPTFDNPEIGAKQIAQLFQESANSTATAGLQEWLTWVEKYPQKNLDWRDRFYLEQRQAGWLSSKEQVYDLGQLERFPILNCAYIYSILLSVKKEQRIGSFVQEDLIGQVMPELLEYPFNPDDFYFGIGRIIRSKSWNMPQYVSGKLASKLRWLSRSLMLPS
ncbi:MAG: hypothetical protein RIG63_21100 [Coleofasciculus chthonoplastes F3-SA18-01]